MAGILREHQACADLDTSSCHIKQTPAKGWALFAKREISASQRILSETPLVSIIKPDLYNARDGQQVPEMGQQFFYLQPSIQSDFLQLSADPKLLKELRAQERMGEHVVDSICSDFRERQLRAIAIFQMNYLDYYDGEHHKWALGITLLQSRINHSCDPNAVLTWNNNLGAFTTHALKKILPGEEITRCYLIDLYESTPFRRIRIMETLGFQCRCNKCITKDVASEGRRVMITNLHRDLDAFLNGQSGTDTDNPDVLALDWGTVLPTIERLIDLYTKEKLVGDGLVDL